jgi:cell division control protein 6
MKLTTPRSKPAKKLFESDDSDNQENDCHSPTKQRKLTADPVEEAKRSLNPAFLTDIKFRDEEYKKVKSFLQTCLSEQRSGGIYISGPPGTGKTLSVSHVTDSLQKEFRFKRLLINCMGCRTPADIYEKILTESGLQTPRKKKDCLEAVTDQIVTPSKGKRRPVTVIIFDEIDELESKNSDVLYTLFAWPQFEGSKVIVIGISNTLDFTKKNLKRFETLKMQSVETVTFHPYTKDQVKGILQSRLPQLPDGSALVTDAALELCARKVSSLCGDIRKALDVIRRAIELAEAEPVSQSDALRVTSDDGFNGTPRKRKTVLNNQTALIQPVGVSFVSKVLNDVYASKALEVRNQKQNLPAQQQLSLCALLLLSKYSGKKETTLSRAHSTFVKICKKKNSGSSAESVSDFLSMCQLLEAKGFVSVKPGKETSLSKISLNVDEAEIEQVMTDRSFLKSILSDATLIII